LFRYEVQEEDPENSSTEKYVLEAIDVKREKNLLTKDKCRFLLKLATYYDEGARIWKVKV